MHLFGRASALALIALSAACAGPAQAPVRPAPKPGAHAGAGLLPATVPALHLMPDVSPKRTLVARTGDGELALVGRMRLAIKPSGAVERAAELLPIGRVVSTKLPARLGGGYVFLAVSGRGTELWRSDDWLAPLTPLVSFGTVADTEKPLVVGFDRVYVRMRTGNELVAIDPRSGATLGSGTLPVAPSLGDMVFLDGWRAVVDTDIAGTFATFDAGATWRRLELTGRVRGLAPSSPDPDDGGDAVIQTDAGTLRLDSGGHVTLRPAGDPGAGLLDCAPGDSGCGGARGKPAALPLGKSPLRVALERGYPDGPGSAVVASQGRLVRVALDTGEVLGVSEHAYPAEHDECVGIALATGAPKAEDQVGFVCGSENGPTSVWALERPLGLRSVMRFDGPRRISESGQGALVVHGPCGASTPDTAPGGARPFCVRFVDGSTREIRIRGNVGAERVVALRDGRVVILVPPRPGSQGQISILKGQGSQHVVLRMPESGAPREVDTGMWLEGFQESGPDEISGWIEAGGPVIGVRVKLDGSVEVGEAVDGPGGVLVSGRFGLVIGDRGHLRESTDAGRTWSAIDLPSFDEPADPPRARRCGPAGCALSGWLKVGWGAPANENDLKDAPSPSPAKLASYKLSASPLKLQCASGASEPKPKSSGKKSEGTPLSSWINFLDVEAPALEKGDVGIDNGVPFDLTPMRAYAWGKKDADWGRSGRFLVRFGDRYALDQVRSSAVTASPWANDGVAADVMGVGTYGYTVQWFAQRDGASALVGACRNKSCTLFGVEAGEPVLSLRGESPGLSRPLPGGAVKLERSWFYLGDAGSPETLGLFRSDLGVVRQVASYRRLPNGRFMAGGPPRLVRRARGGGLGLLFTQKQGPLDRRGTRWVLPIDPESGKLGDAISLGRPDLADLRVEAGCSERDGWIAELPLESAPDATLDGARVALDGVELRLVLGPGSACFDAGVATLSSVFETGKKPGKGAKGGAEAAATLIVTDRSSGTRREARCSLVR